MRSKQGAGSRCPGLVGSHPQPNWLPGWPMGCLSYQWSNVPRGPLVAPRSKAEIEPRFPALQPISGNEKAQLPPRGTQYSGRRWSRMAGPERRGPEGRLGPERKEPSREGDFPDLAGSWWGKWKQLTHINQGQRTVLVCWEQLLGAGVWARWPPRGAQGKGGPRQVENFWETAP